MMSDVRKKSKTTVALPDLPPSNEMDTNLVDN